MTEKTVRGKALLVIEAICCTNMSLDNTECDKMLSFIYQCVHVALGTCTNPHEDWIDLINKSYEVICK